MSLYSVHRVDASADWLVKNGYPKPAGYSGEEGWNVVYGNGHSEESEKCRWIFAEMLAHLVI